jgi:hypothetical protein
MNVVVCRLRLDLEVGRNKKACENYGI